MRAAVAMPEFAPDGRRRLHGHGRAGGRQDLADALAGSTLRLLLVGPARDGAGARARVPQPAAARAAGGGAGGGGDTFGRDGAAGRAADDGLDRRAAGAARPRGRLRDPVPGAVEEEGDPSGRRASRCRRSRRPALATVAGFLVLLLSPVPMVRGFGVLLVAGIVLAFALALTAGTAALALPPVAGARDRPLARSCAAPASCSTAAPAAPARARGRPRAGGRGRRARRCGGRSCVLAVGLVLAVAGWAVDSRTEVVSDIAARAGGPAGRPGPPRAPALDRRGRGDRRPRRGRRPHRARGRAPGCATTGGLCSRATATRPSAGCGAPSCARRCRCPTVPERRSRRATRPHPRPARRRAAVLLRRGHHARPAHREPRVRHPAHVARAPAGDHRGHARRLDPPPGRGAPARRPAGARGRGERDAVGLRCGGSATLAVALLAVLAVLLVMQRRHGAGARPGRARGCRWSRSRSRPAGRRWCCGCSACR